MVELEWHQEGTILPIKAQPGARRNEIRGEQNGALKVSVTQIPEKGKANKVFVEFIAKSLKLRKSQVDLLTGETSTSKKFLIRDITVEELSEKIAPFL